MAEEVERKAHSLDKAVPLSAASDQPAEKSNSLQPVVHPSSQLQKRKKESCIQQVYRFLGPKASPARSLNLHSESHDAEDEQEASSEVKVGFIELFFDLVFVAVVVRLGVLYKDELSWHRTWEVVVLFTTYWLTWFHANMLLTRFRIRSLWYSALFCVMLGTLLLSAMSIRESVKYKNVVSKVFHSSAIGVFAFTRFCYVFIYGAIVIYNDHARPLVGKYLWCFIISLVLSLVGMTTSDMVTIEVVWPVALLTEFLMYPMADLTTDDEHSLPINVEHNVERNGLWVVLILGESVISLSGVTNSTYDVNYILTVVVGFFIVFMMLLLYMLSQPEHHCGMDTHACDIGTKNILLFNLSHLGLTMGLFGMGIGLKFMVYYAGPNYAGKEFNRNHAWLFTGAVSFALLWLNIARSSHRWAEYGGISRSYMWAAHVAVSLAISPLALLVDKNGKGDGFSTSELLFVVAFFVCILWCIDAFLRPSEENWAVFQEFKEELERIKTDYKNAISAPSNFKHVSSNSTHLSGPANFQHVLSMTPKLENDPALLQYHGPRNKSVRKTGQSGRRRTKSSKSLADGDDEAVTPQQNWMDAQAEAIRAAMGAVTRKRSQHDLLCSPTDANGHLRLPDNAIRVTIDPNDSLNDDSKSSRKSSLWHRKSSNGVALEGRNTLKKQKSNISWVANTAVAKEKLDYAAMWQQQSRQATQTALDMRMHEQAMQLAAELDQEAKVTSREQSDRSDNHVLPAVTFVQETSSPERPQLLPADFPEQADLSGDVARDDSLIETSSPLDRSDAAFKSVKRTNPAFDQAEGNQTGDVPDANSADEHSENNTRIASLIETDAL
eukprot:m.1241461 g.1241461  ORF g.1241461 m.1241461 type:complete len:836 (-) comp24679_c1_seq1:1754-4261(-)